MCGKRVDRIDRIDLIDTSASYNWKRMMLEACYRDGEIETECTEEIIKDCVWWLVNEVEERCLSMDNKATENESSRSNSICHSLSEDNSQSDDDDSLVNRITFSPPSSLSSSSFRVPKIVEDIEQENSFDQESNAIRYFNIDDPIPLATVSQDHHKSNVVEDSELQTENENPIELNGILINNDASPQISTVSNDQNNETSNSYERIWNKRKFLMEKEAEFKAQKRIREHNQDGKSLQQVIDTSLKDYSEFCEMAHTVRLKFEEEKAKFLEVVQRMIGNSSVSTLPFKGKKFISLLYFFWLK